MRRIVVSALVWVLTATAALAQIVVGGSGVGAPVGIPANATIWHGTTAPPATVGANGDYYLNTVSNCLYGPKLAGVWPSACSTSVSQLGYVAEYIGNKGAPGGYAPLDANMLVPASNLPAVAAINGTTIPGSTTSVNNR